MFSVMTMASSTTRPTESTTASIESTLIEKPATYIRKKVPMSATGMTKHGMSVTHQFRKKRKLLASCAGRGR